MNMRFTQLAEWLAWQEGLHPSAIDMGLERIRVVLQRLQVAPPRCPVITIAGTKGKGSCAALLDSMLRAAGYQVGLFTSPHLRQYNERIRINGVMVTDAELCAAFERIDQARGEISLTYFEFNTLAALLCFDAAALDVWILEVGMGGRLDAVNVVDADVAIVTSIGLDHTEWLGSDLNSIAREKAGIFRAGRPALFGSSDMPEAIQQVAEQVGAVLLRAGQDFSYAQQSSQWSWQMQQQRLEDLPLPALSGEVQLANASCVLAALYLLRDRLPIDRKAIEQGLRQVQLLGRLQRIQHAGAEWILDVAHNALSASVLAQHLASLPRLRTLAVMGIMADKDIDGMVQVLSSHIDAWLPVALPGTRALSVTALTEHLRSAKVNVLPACSTLPAAFAVAESCCADEQYQRVLVFGSFLTVGPALDWLAL
ncbi:MAG: bifunctional tetrahydrofolate synthase/dihydrofolate synthase [Steroidobacteraceae bacterium]